MVHDVFKFFVFLLVFFVVSIHYYNEVLMVLTFIILWSVTSFSPVKVCVQYFRALMLGLFALVNLYKGDTEMTISLMTFCLKVYVTSRKHRAL